MVVVYDLSVIHRGPSPEYNARLSICGNLTELCAQRFSYWKSRRVGEFKYHKSFLLTCSFFIKLDRTGSVLEC